MSDFNDDKDVQLGRKLHRVMKEHKEDTKADKVSKTILVVILLLIGISSCLWMNGVTP